MGLVMTPKPLGIVYPANDGDPARTRIEHSRLADVAAAFARAGVQIVDAAFTDDIAQSIEARLAHVAGVLVWFNPIEGGRDRSRLNAMLRAVAGQGAFVSAHPDVIDRLGTKDVLYRTRGMGWGSDTRRHASTADMRHALEMALQKGPRVLKQMRGQSGDGVWKVSLPGGVTGPVSPASIVRVRHAKRGSVEEEMPFGDFLRLCEGYFAAGGAMIDQAYQERLTDGMIRCYLVADHVVGFGEQLINALYPAPDAQPPREAPQPGPRLYFPPDRADFQSLKNKLERIWVPEMCRILALSPSDLPVLWDADFLYGPKDAEGADTYVLCEINVSSVHPFPPSALDPLVTETCRRLEAGR